MMFEFRDFTVTTNPGDHLYNYVNGTILFHNTGREHEFLYRIHDPANGSSKKLVSIDWGYLNPDIETLWHEVERTICNKIWGLYICSCGNEILCDFPYQELHCDCGNTIQRGRYISDDDARKIINVDGWWSSFCSP